MTTINPGKTSVDVQGIHTKFTLMANKDIRKEYSDGEVKVT
jgi:hypothetical protein